MRTESGRDRGAAGSKRQAVANLGHSTNPAYPHQAPLRVPEHTGLHVENPEALALYCPGGTQVEGSLQPGAAQLGSVQVRALRIDPQLETSPSLK